jgi:lysine-specific histone demethylase 1
MLVFCVNVFRDRIGGRIHSLSFQHDGIGCAVDLGASIVTGIVGNPLALLCKQLNIEMHTIDTECPLYQSNGEIVPELDDSRAEKAWHRILEGTDKLRKNAEKDSSLGEAIQMINEKIVRFVGENEKGLLKWHIANLEYGCATSLNNVSLLNWDQDDSFDFAGDHCFLKSGFGALVDHLSKEIQVKLNEFVSSIRYTGESVFVSTSSNSSYSGDVVVVSLPLGVLKEGRIKFVPELPLDKLQSIRKLGYGLINKVILTFENPFWKDTVASDMFGIVKDGSSEEDWSKFFLFWNMYNTTGAPVLVSIIAAKAAVNSEALTNEQLSEEALSTLRSVFPEISNPSRVEVTRWGSDDFSRGSYSYVAKGSSGADYKVLKGNVDGKLFFIGEATNAENPASASGAYTSGLREAGWIHRRLSSECLKYDLHLHLSRQKSLETSEVKQDQVEVDIPSAFRSQSPSRLAYKSQLQDMLKKALDGDLEDINPAFVHSVPAYHTGVNEESSSPIETDSSESIDSTQESISSPPLQMPSLSSFASVSKQKRRSSPDSKHKTKRPKLESKSTKVVSKSSADSNEFKVLVDIVSPCIKKMLREWPNKLNASTFKVVYKRTIGHVCKMWKKKNCPKPKKFWHERRQAKVSALMEKYVNETSQTGQ